MMVKLLFLLLCPLVLSAQNAGKSNLILFSLQKKADSLWQPERPIFLSAFNKGGYSNQPSFFGSYELWVTAQFKNDTTQTDLIALDLLSKNYTRITATPQTAEYSPTLMPGGKRFSAVRVEADGNQRLWSFPLDRSDNGRVEFPRIYNVGYHCWLRDTLVALFIVGDTQEPHTLQIVGKTAQKQQRIASNIGRCLVAKPDGKLLFVQKPTEQTWYLKTWDPRSNLQEIVVKMPDGTEDFVLLPDGIYLAANGAKLYQFNPRRSQDWKLCADFSKYGIRKITRLAVSKDLKLVMVVE